MNQRRRIRSILNYDQIERNMFKYELSETEKSIISQGIREKKFNLRTRVKSQNSKADLCRDQREYEDKMKLSIAQIVDLENKQNKLTKSAVYHKNNFRTIFSIPKPKYTPSIVYGVLNNKTSLQFNELVKKL